MKNPRDLRSQVDLGSEPICLYSAKMAAHCAELCKLAYQKGHTVRQVATESMGGFGYTMMVPIDVGGTQGFVLGCQKRITIVWRGTSSARDWLDDFRIARVRWPGVLEGRVHAGFKAQLRRVESELVHAVSGMMVSYPRAKVVATGHSLGGSLATLTPPLLLAHSLPAHAVYSIEAPRLFNREAAEYVGDFFPIHRIVCVHPGGQMDLITRAPPSKPGPWPLGWWHPVCTPRIHYRGKVFTISGLWESLRAEYPVPWWQALRVITRASRAVKAHSIDFAVKTLREQAK